jgi:autoinducer 2-degrading protein
MAKLAIIATIEVAPRRRDELLPLLQAHRARCLKDEPGTVQFDLLLPHEGSDKVMIYEVYQDAATYVAKGQQLPCAYWPATLKIPK